MVSATDAQFEISDDELHDMERQMLRAFAARSID